MTNFVHLRVHSEYSLADSIIRVPALLSAVRERGMPSVALTDWHNLFAEVKFYREALKQGIKPLIGVDCLVASAVLDKPAELVLLVQNEIGYKHLTGLISAAYQRGQVRGVPIIDSQWLVNHTDGLIALSGGRGGELGKLLLSGQTERAVRQLKQWQTLFPGRFYLEVQRTGRANEESYIQQVVDLA
ncbi:MAG TPA: PHP domain-containing protein, partial [Flavobacteriales bacterium]|nr:PHP domain-containing protein [Flavobacteriales bacterium]